MTILRKIMKVHSGFGRVKKCVQLNTDRYETK